MSHIRFLQMFLRVVPSVFTKFCFWDHQNIMLYSFSLYFRRYALSQKSRTVATGQRRLCRPRPQIHEVGTTLQNIGLKRSTKTKKRPLNLMWRVCPPSQKERAMLLTICMWRSVIRRTSLFQKIAHTKLRASWRVTCGSGLFCLRTHSTPRSRGQTSLLVSLCRCGIVPSVGAGKPSHTKSNSLT